jgi:hypothetical protein
MSRAHQPSQTVSEVILTQHGEFTAVEDVGIFYIGLGDQFDDDRRLVREAASVLQPAMQSSWVWRFSSGYFGR